MQDTLTKPYQHALELADLAIDDKFVTLALVEGVIQLDENNDVILTAKTVISTDYAEGTVTYHDGLSTRPITQPLSMLGIPNIEAGDEWNPEICSITLNHAVKLVRDKMGKREPLLAPRQLSGLEGAIKPDWEKK